MLEQRGGQVELIACRAKLVALFSQGTWHKSQFEQDHTEITLQTLELVLPLYPSRETNLWSHSLLTTGFSPPNQETYPEHVDSYMACPTVASEQRAQPRAFPICRTKHTALSGQGIHYTPFPHSSPKTTSHASPGSHSAAPPGQGGYILLSEEPSPDGLISLTREPRQL